ncbi:MAG: PorV/PorQ family protein [bacterium]
MKIITVSLSAGLIIFQLSAVNCFAKGAGSSAGENLLRPVSAKSAAMAHAHTALSGDALSLHNNPAGLASLKNLEILTMYQKGLDEDNFASVVLGKNFSFGTCGASIQYYDTGKIELYDLNGNKINKTGQKDIIANVGIGIPVFENFSAGLNAKTISSEIFGNNASAFAVDAGIQYAGQVNIGLAMQNFGSELTYISAGDPLPKKITLGASYTKELTDHSITAALDLPYYLNEEETLGLIGIEYSYNHLFAVRAGYRANLSDSSTDDEGAITGGIGFNWNNYSLDYAISITEDLSNPHYISAGMKF